MAGKKLKSPEGDKSQQLAAAAMGAGTELVQAQAEPLQSVALEQAADAQGVDLVAEEAAVLAAALAIDQQPSEEAARLAAEQHAAEEAQLAAEAQAAEAARLAAEQQANAVWLRGQFDVKAKSPAGFWRCGVQFLHSSQTRVFVVNSKADVPHDHDCSVVCCYLTPDEARRVYQDPWLTVVPGSEVIKV